MHKMTVLFTINMIFLRPIFIRPSVNEYGHADGEPGPKYWTNKASYKIAATLDDVKDAIREV